MTMMPQQSMSPPSLQVFPGRGIGPFILGSSLFDILKLSKSDPQLTNGFDLSFSGSKPATSTVNLTSILGIRLRFDGPEQRLRLIEVIDFTSSRLVYNNHEMFRESDSEARQFRRNRGPAYRNIIKMFGPTFPGEYIPPSSEENDVHGVYICSYPGIAFSLPVDPKIWATNKEVATKLSSSTAASMAIFNGRSWPEAVPTLFTPSIFKPRPRSVSISPESKLPDEILSISIHGEGRIEISRRTTPQLWITLNETTSQDLLMELGPPDAIYRKSDRRLKIHKTQRTSSRTGHDTDTDLSSAQTDESDQGEFDEDPALTLNNREIIAAEHFFNYFHLGIDFLISQPTHPSAPSPTMPEAKTFESSQARVPPKNHLAVTKLMIHGNVPGSWNFGRYRRCQWTLQHVPCARATDPLTSEMHFSQISKRLNDVYSDTDGDEKDAEKNIYQRGMTLNRGLGASPSSSYELLGGWEEDISHSKNEESINDGSKSLETTSELFGYPGMVFEVLNNGSINCLTIY